MRRLLQIGFEQVGSWRLRDATLALDLTRMNGQRNVLYAFVQGEAVLYVGKTTNSLERRLGGYLRPSDTQRTNVRNNAALLELLRREKSVDIFAWADPGMHRIGEFHLNQAAGLEDSIIEVVAPPWNGARSAPPATARPPGPAQSDSDGAVSAERLDTAPDKASGESATPSELETLEHDGVIQACPTFDVILGTTYYHHGFFNVPVRFSEMLPDHGAELSLYCGAARTLIRAKVDRNANQTSHTPRIYGRAPLASWFSLAKRLGDKVTIWVISVNEIELL